MMMMQGSLILLILLIFGSPFVDASITIVDSGRTYSSTMDKVHGIKLVDGVRYSAHLQQIPGNEHLCFGYQNWNVTVPSDGYPGKYSKRMWKQRTTDWHTSNSLMLAGLESYEF